MALTNNHLYVSVCESQNCLRRIYLLLGVERKQLKVILNHSGQLQSAPAVAKQ